MPSTKLSRMLAVLRRYTGAQAKDRVPEEMIEEFKAAAGEATQSPPKAAAPDENRPKLH